MQDYLTPRLPKQPNTKIYSMRRVTLLGSVALIGAGLLVGGGNDLGRFATPSVAIAAADALQGPPSFADLAAKVKPAVISVQVKVDQSADPSDASPDVWPSFPPSMEGSPFEKFFREYGFNDSRRSGPQSHFVTGVGSGFFISSDGFAVTNNHVVDHAKSVQVTTDDGTIYTAKVIGTDSKTDLALIKVDGKANFAYVNFADHSPRIGDWVMAVGNPYNLGGTVTAGIVSARGRDIGSGPYDDYIQIDAPINKGNSGGPAFDMSGNVIGVNTAIYSPSGGSIGIGFDIPAETAKIVVAQLRNKGVVTRGWLGVQIQPVTPEIADSLGLKKVAGALVDAPQANSPAAKAGIAAGDVITAVNGTAIKDSRDLARHVATMAPGSSVNLDILRKGEMKTITVALGTMPNQRQVRADNRDNKATSGVPNLGLTVAPADDVAGAGNVGVVVTSVDPDGAAAEHGIKSGDVILDVGGNAITSPAAVRKAVSDAKVAGKRDVLIRLKTSDATRFVAMPVG